MAQQADALQDFISNLKQGDVLARLQAGLIGEGLGFETIFGTQSLLYADYTASGRALRQVEDFITENVLPFYANTHTEASLCGLMTGRLRERARAEIARITKAGPECHVIFAGSGATGGAHRLVGGYDIAGRVARGQRVVVLIGPYEHHSNLLPWRESGAEIVNVPEAGCGGPCMAALDKALAGVGQADLVIGAFSAASNVTGILTDVDAVTRRLKQAGALAIWDYAAGAPYLAIDMGRGETAKDAVIYSSHKFPGGPGASGVLLLRGSPHWRDRPAFPGGGTVRFVSPWSETYSSNLVSREEAGTPNVVGDIRAALVMLVKEAIGQELISARDHELRERALAVWARVPQIELLGQCPGATALPIFSFRVNDGKGGRVHHQLFTRLLSDHDGIQARGGCACAGGYAHNLLGLDRQASDAIENGLANGCELDRPGWVRLNLSYLHTDAQADRIIQAVARLAVEAPTLAKRYRGDPATARFAPIPEAVPA